MQRWRIERDYQELKQEIGLGHYEGRGWRGFHHHASLCIAAYGFLIAERAAFPPSAERSTPLIQAPAFPKPTGHGEPPIRPERHVANSIATMRAASHAHSPAPCRDAHAATPYRTVASNKMTQ